MTEHGQVPTRELRAHPIYSVLNDQAARGYVPTEQELDELRLPPEHRRKVGAACKVAAAIRAGGEHAAATQSARDAALAIVSDLPPELQRPDYLRPPDPTPDDPRGLADQVPQW
jgi:hypothetical protein